MEARDRLPRKPKARLRVVIRHHDERIGQGVNRGQSGVTTTCHVCQRERRITPP